MSNTYLVGYDLRAKNKDYKGLFEELKKFGLWWHYLDSTWIIQTNESPKDVFSRLSIYLDESDQMLVIQVEKNWWGWLPKEGHNWIRENVV